MDFKQQNYSLKEALTLIRNVFGRGIRFITYYPTEIIQISLKTDLHRKGHQRQSERYIW